MDRRTFLARAGLVATWAGIPITISCGGDEDGGMNPPPSGGSGDVTGTVQAASGHTHSGAVVTAAQITAGNAVMLTLTGSGHTHTANLSAQQVMDVGDGVTVSVQSSTDSGHSHTVTFN
jgi:hypothetical protein